jgi:GH24 family phage-related lysozyme (muramidase)
MIDWNFISAREGRQQTTAYVPTNTKTHNVIMRSGVTIATGFDIGQWNVHDLKSLGLPSDIVTLFTPYASPLRGAAAAAKLKADQAAGHPLTISQAQANLIDAAVKRYFERQFQRSYDRGARAQGKIALFGSLPSAIQTAIASFMFQFGPGIGSHRYAQTPQYKFYQMITEQNWQGAIEASESCAGPTSRRRAEQQLIRSGASELSGRRAIPGAANLGLGSTVAAGAR